MCSYTCIEFGQRNLKESEIKDKSIIEVGSYNVNGSLREMIQNMNPKSYLGVDMELGLGVDRICKADELIKEFGSESFDLVVSTEMLEHVENWKEIIHNLKNILKVGGTLLITTRSKGFPYHPYPIDMWRYEISDMQHIFSDYEIEVLESDQFEPGVFMKAKKISNTEKDLSEYSLYCMI